MISNTDKESKRMDLQTIANEIRRDVIRMTYAAGSQGAHIGGSLSMCEIMAVLYHSVLTYDARNPTSENRDRFILSKGHGAIALYAALKSIGLLSDDELLSYKQDGSIITAHPTFMPKKGMEFASGSLGQGLSIGVGVALALKKKQMSNCVYVLVGDGECDEGSIWEAAASASHYGLDNLICIVDKNQLQYDGTTTEILNMGSLKDKFTAFGWDAIDVDGHNCEALRNAFALSHKNPLAVICNTVKGKGVSFIENNYKWHNASLNESQFNQAIEEQEA